MSSELQRWVDGIPAPEGLESGLRDGVRRRRRARSAKAAALAVTTAACLAVAITVAPWQRLGVIGTDPASRVPSVGPCDTTAGEDPPVEDDLLVAFEAPPTAVSGSSIRVPLLLRNTGSRTIHLELPATTHLCWLADLGGGETVVSEFAEPARRLPMSPFSLGQDNHVRLMLAWNLGACTPGQPAFTDGCGPGGPARPGTYRLRAVVTVHADGRNVTRVVQSDRIQVRVTR